jgi:hypothetical protein
VAFSRKLGSRDSRKHSMSLLRRLVECFILKQLFGCGPGRAM